MLALKQDCTAAAVLTQAQCMKFESICNLVRSTLGPAAAMKRAVMLDALVYMCVTSRHAVSINRAVLDARLTLALTVTYEPWPFSPF